jgi:hypothetical protein
MLQYLSQMVFLGMLDVFFLLRWIGQFGTNEPSSPSKLRFAGSIPLKTNTVVTVKPCASSGTSNRSFSLEWHICFSNQLNRPVLTNRAYLHLEKPKLHVVFHWKTKAILTAKKVLNVLAYNTNGFLLKVPCVSSTLLNTPIWNKESLPSNWNT